MTATLKDVKNIAHIAHKHQLDKIGVPYVHQPHRVAKKVRAAGGTWVQEQAAWLHDVVEDTSFGFLQLRDLGVTTGVLDIVDALTKRDDEVRGDYYQRVKDCPGARLVKLCDIYDNMDPARQCYLAPEDQVRLIRKYARALDLLS